MSSTPEQLAVIAEPNENKLVVALPGSGKTRVTVNLANKITEQPAASVLMVTFTNNATNEIQARINQLLAPHQAKRVTIMTFAKVMLRQYAQLGTNKRLIVGGELTNYYYRIAKRHGIDFRELEDYQQACEVLGRSMDTPDVDGKYMVFYEELQTMLHKFKRVDLNTVAREVIMAMQQGCLHPHTFSHCIVDEFQDTDELQLQWLLCHLSPKTSFCVVGDDDQSIYGWRGAKGYENMVQFQEAFNAHAYMLSTCFRCAPAILGLSQQLIEFNASRIEKDMKSGKKLPGKVTVLETPVCYVSPYTETLLSQNETSVPIVPRFLQDAPLDTYRHIVDHIENDHDELAILCRTNKHLDCLEYCLNERGISVKRLGGRSIFDNPHVIGFIKLLIGFVRPKEKVCLVEGLGWLDIEDEVIDFVHFATPDSDLLSRASQKSDGQVLHQISMLRSQSINEKPDPSHIMKELVVIIDKHVMSNLHDTDVFRMASVRTIVGIFSKQKGSFTQRVDTLQRMLMGTETKQQNTKSKGVVLCTMTGAKGLEWKRVLLMMLNRNVIPSNSITDSSLSHVEEERRLLFVAMTRAEEELTLHYMSGKHSKFLKELGLVG